MTPEDWQDFSDKNILNAEQQRNLSVQLRSMIDGILQQSANDMSKQVETTNIAFDKRISETRDAKAKLEDHLSKVTLPVSAAGNHGKISALFCQYFHKTWATLNP